MLSTQNDLMKISLDSFSTDDRVDLEELTPEQILRLMIKSLKEKRKGKKITRTPEQLSLSLSQMETEFREYYEKNIFKILGGVAWWMGQTRIQKTVEEAFRTMQLNGCLMSETEFNTKEDPTRFRLPGDQKRSQDLSRIWGANYLKEKFAELGIHNYLVPRFIVVVKDEVRTLSVFVKKNISEQLSVECLDPLQATIFVEWIEEAESDTENPDHQWLKGIGYVDFSRGNILKKDNRFYVVDTEWRSLSSADRQNEDLGLESFARDRFEAVYPSHLIKCEIPL